MNNTQDLSKFGLREKKITSELLALLGTEKDQSNLYENISVEFNPNSGMVFLVDSDFNVAVLNNGFLVDFISCPNCGNEAAKPDFKDEYNDKCCIEYFNEIA